MLFWDILSDFLRFSHKIGTNYSHFLSLLLTTLSDMHAYMLSHVWLFVTPRTVARQAPLSMGFLRQEYWSGFLFPSPGDLPDPGIKPASPVFPALAGGFFTSEPPGTLRIKCNYICKDGFVITKHVVDTHHYLAIWLGNKDNYCFRSWIYEKSLLSTGEMGMLKIEVRWDSELTKLTPGGILKHT